MIQCSRLAPMGAAGACLFLATASVPAELTRVDEGLLSLIAPSQPIEAAPPIEETHRRGAFATIDLDALEAFAAEAEGRAALTLFDDRSFIVESTHVQRHAPDNYVVRGGLVDDGGSFVLVRDGDIVMANIWTVAAGAHHVRTLPDGRYVMREIDSGVFPGCGTPDDPAWDAAPIEDAPTEGGTVCVDDGSVIKVLIVFTPAAAMGLGGQSMIQSFAQLNIASTNQSYANSGVSTSVQLAGFTITDYQESGDSSTDLNRLADPNDGFMDEIPVLRDELNADLVAMIVESFSVCGRAFFAVTFGNVPNASLGYSVSRRSCAVDNLTFAHELGHNQGSRHDRAADSNNGAYTYSHGHVAFGAQFRTVMATSNLQAPRIPYFSNPDVLFNGQPTGVPITQPDSAHNAMSISQTAHNVANFRVEECIPFGDLNEDTQVNGVDIAILLSVWGTDGGVTGADLNGDGVVDGADLALVLSNWTG